MNLSASWRFNSRSRFHPRLSAFICGFIALLSGCAVAAAQPVVITDDRGKTLALPRPAQRIVTLAPHLAELAFAAGAGARLVGVARFSDFPREALAVTQIGDAARVDVERVLALRPDLVLAWKSGNQAGDVGRLERLGLAVFVTEPARLADIPRVLRAIGLLAGTAPAAERTAVDFERGLQALRVRHGTLPKVGVFYEVWHRPLITVNGAHVISDVIALCGGENVFAAAPTLTPAVSLEAVLAARPEVILGGTRPGGDERFAREWREGPIAALRALPVFYVDPDLIQRQTPRVLEGARAVCSALEQVRISRQDAKAAKKIK
ncbi:MAG: cobalamin-binding protein [Betaproteobacteria bacterium]|nr:cobalamin-binding protein [Betaproteobacteria bacterium]